MQTRKVRVAKNIMTCDVENYSYARAQRFCANSGFDTCPFIKNSYDKDQTMYCYLFFDCHGNAKLVKDDKGNLIRPPQCVQSELELWNGR
jgi:hypothetical protein